MCPNVSPKPIQTYSRTRRFRACDLKHPRSNPQADICCNDLDARNPFGQLPSLSCSQLCATVQFASVFVQNGIDFLTCAVCQGGCGAEVGMEVAVAFEDVEFVCGFLLVLIMR